MCISIEKKERVNQTRPSCRNHFPCLNACSNGCLFFLLYQHICVFQQKRKKTIRTGFGTGRVNQTRPSCLNHFPCSYACSNGFSFFLLYQHICGVQQKRKKTIRTGVGPGFQNQRKQCCEQVLFSIVTTNTLSLFKTKKKQCEQKLDGFVCFLKDLDNYIPSTSSFDDKFHIQSGSLRNGRNAAPHSCISASTAVLEQTRQSLGRQGFIV